MHAFRYAATLLTGSSLVLGAASAMAQDYPMPSDYYDAVGAKLMNSGYRGIRVIDADAGKVLAYDASGSEVVLTVHPSNRKIVNSTYVHAADH